MADNQETPAQSRNQESSGQITPELVQRVADKVYALWQQELRIEQERRPRNRKRF